MYINIDYGTRAYIGEKKCSRCGRDFDLENGLMIGLLQGGDVVSFFICRECLDMKASFQSVEFDLAKDRYPILGYR